MTDTIKVVFQKHIMNMRVGEIISYGVTPNVDEGRIDTEIKVLMPDETIYTIIINPPKDSDDYLINFRENNTICPSCSGVKVNPYSTSTYCLACGGNGYVNKKDVEKFKKENPNKKMFIEKLNEIRKNGKKHKEIKHEEE